MRLLLLLCLTFCSPTKDIRVGEKIPAQKEEMDELFDFRLKSPRRKKNSVLLLLPTSGRNGSVGKNILNACILAANDAKDIDFYPVDAADPSVEKFRIYDHFKGKNLKAVIGPIFSSETKQYGALFSKIPILSFSNDQRINSDHVFACGLSLYEEIQSLFSYAHVCKVDSFLVMLPRGETGDQILEIIETELKKYGLEKGDDWEIIRYASISRKAATKYVKNSGKKAVFVIDPVLIAPKLKDMRIFTVSSAALSNPELWDGAIFAFFDNREQREFVEKYHATFGIRPTVLDMIGFDLARIVCESVNSGESIIGSSYRGCLGDFSVNKKLGLKREFQIFRLKGGQRAELSSEEINDIDEK
jgi:hypothetical protein